MVGIPHKGVGLSCVILIYFVGISQASSLPFISSQDHKTQVIALVVTHAILCLINYLLAKFLNRNGVKHSVGGMPLEKFVIYFSLIFSFLVLIMVYGEFFKV